MSLASIIRRYYLFLFIGQAVFWYSVELILLRERGLSDQLVVIMGAVSFGSGFALEPITSKLADKHSRKNTLLVAMVILLLTTIYEVAFAFSGIELVVAGLLWSIYRATFSGTGDAWLYDTLNEHGKQSTYRKVTSRAQSFELAALLIGSVGGGIVTHIWGVESTFWITVALVISSIIIFMGVPEPKVQDRDQQNSHIRRSIKHVFNNLNIRSVLIPAVALSSWMLVWYEYSQLYFESVGLNAVLFGTSFGMLYLSGIVGSEISHKKSIDQKKLGAVMLLISVMSLYMTIFIGVPGLMIMFVIFALFAFARPYIKTVVQDNTPSAIRATTLSILSGIYKAVFMVSAGMLLVLGVENGLIALAVLFTLASVLYGLRTAFNKSV